MKSLRTWICFWLIAVVLSCYVRLYPLRAHIWDPSYDQATMVVIYNIKKSLIELIHQNNPSIPPSIAEQMATEKLNETLRKEPEKVQAYIQEASRKIFKASGQKANIYLLESDTYYFYYLTENIVRTGRMADVVKGSKYLDPLMAAPEGFWQPNTYHPYVGYYVYRLFQIFDPNVSLMSAVAYTPLIIMIFVLAAFFWAGRSLGLSAAATFIGSLSFSLAPIILKRSALGWFRTDPYNLLFTLLILITIIKLITDPKTKNFWKQSIICGIFLTLFASIWQGWGFMLVMSLAILGICCLYSLINRNFNNTRRFALLGVAVLVSSLVGISLLFGFADFFALIKEGFLELQKFTVKKFGLWPNLFMEVGELKKSTTEDFLIDSGGLFFLLGSLGGLLYSFWQVVRKRQDESTLRFIALFTFLIVCILMSCSAERFFIFAMIGLSLFFAIATEGALQFISVSKLIWIRVVIVLGLSTCFIINGNKSIRTVLTPIFNSAWEKALIDLKNKTPEDSIINSWWPPGHFIKGIAHRRVMFDGATLSQSATGYWMANVLLSNDEAQAAGLLRMINLSGNKAVDFLIAKGLKTSQAVALLSTIASKSNSEALLLLEVVLHNKEDAKTLLLLIRGGSPHSYVLLYNELVDQNLGLAFMGRWNIQRVEEINESPSLLSSIPSRNSPAYLDFLWGMAGGQTHYSPPLQFLHEDDQNLYFSENLVINKTTMKAKIDSSTYGRGNLQSTVYLNGGHITENLNVNADLKYAVVLYGKDKEKLARLMDRNLANSVLIKLFLFDAQGLEHFKLLTSSNDLTGRTQIKTYELTW